MAPKLIVFDLDATLWKPELYTLRKIAREGRSPTAGADIQLFDDVMPIFSRLETDFPDTRLAIASRTDKGQWAHELIRSFNLPIDRGLVEIYTGSKTQHFSALAEKTRLPFSDMLFFDDARDGRWGNCEIAAKMGVLSAYVPKPTGLTLPIFEHALECFAAGERGKIVDPPAAAPALKRRGHVKNINSAKNYGFIKVEGERDVFFHASAVRGRGSMPSNGDLVEIAVGMNRGKVGEKSCI